jgi:hypothetical protein
MRRLLLALGLSLTLASAVLAQGAPPPGTESELNAARAHQCWLYGVPEAACAAPIQVDVVPTPEALPTPWQGLPGFAAGAAQPAAGRFVVILSRCGPYPFGDAGQTLRHELSHVLLFRGLGFQAPRWFDEGLAMRASAEWGFRDEVFAALALPMVAHGSWRLDRVDADFSGGESEIRRSYALAKGFVRDLFHDDEDLRGFLEEARRERSLDRAFLYRFGTTPDGAFRAWAKHLPWWGEWVVALSGPEVLWLGVLALFLLAAFAGWRRRRKKYEALDD